MKNTTQFPDVKFVAISKEYNSIERAKLRIASLLGQGYICTFSNGNRQRFER
jgi:hypothetical protein